MLQKRGVLSLSDPQPIDDKKPKRMYASALCIFLASIFLLSFHMGMPNGNVLDENHYVSGAKALFHQTPAMFHGKPDTNPEHPPLGKYLIGLGLVLDGDNPTGWRIAPVLFGALTLTVIFLWMYQVANPFTAWMAVLLVLTNGFWFVMSRVAMLSIFEVCFCVCGFYFLSQEKFVLSGVSLGLAMACRWNAAFALALIAGWLVIRKNPQIKKAAVTSASALVAYTVAFLPAVHFRIGDFIRAQAFILHFHVHADCVDFISQEWYLWPFRHRPDLSLNFLLANPISVIVGVIAVIFLLAKSKHKLLALAPIVFYLQWAVTPRPFEFYYYFLDTVVFLSIAAAVMLSECRFKVKWFPVACISLSVVWFALYYTDFAYLPPAPWDSLLSSLKY
jgi:dolichyl-phosphate-mannose-protein mannosyltransferase